MGRVYQYQEEERAIIRECIKKYLLTNEKQYLDLGDVAMWFGEQDGYEALNYIEGDDQTYKFDWNYLESTIAYIEERVNVERLRRAKIDRIRKTAEAEGWSKDKILEAVANA